MEKYSPMMQHYISVKKDYPDTLIFYRLGDFYELFFDDAKIVSNECNLVLTGKNAGVKDRVPMCGVPHHAVNPYIQKLILRGYKVAIVEQLEDPKQAKGIVKRDVIQIITPGTLMDEENNKSSIFIASLYDYQYGVSLALCEMASGELYIKTIKKNGTSIIQELLKDNIREIVVSSNFDEKIIKMIRDLGSITISYCDDEDIEERYLPLIEDVKEYYYRHCFGKLINYLQVTQKRMLDHLRPVIYDNDDLYLQMDFNTRVNLEITENSRTNIKTITLWQFLDHCQTAMGSRLLKRWLEKPLINKNNIVERQQAIEFFKNDFLLRDNIKEQLHQIYDIERLIARIAFGSANAIDGLRLSKSLNALPKLITELKNLPGYQNIHNLNICDELRNTIDQVFSEDAPVSIKEGGMFVDGYNEELDELRNIKKDAKKVIASLEQKEREKTGIKNLKVGYNKVFGYYYEVSKANMNIIKESDGYTKKQTLTNAERLVTEELKEIEDKIIHADERSLALEYELFIQLMNRIKEDLPKLQKIADSVAIIDVLYSLGVVSSGKQYTKPIFTTNNEINIKKGRHPILDVIMKERKFVANDLKLENEERIMVLTGPNMGGKSTFMRQNALISIMAQIGCFVPAESCQIPIFDKIFTRIGANDDILSGQSTFMVEMMEANNALCNATKNSLIIFDEIGRGTSTYDGMALAQAMIEYLAKEIKAITLFSTHYHELTKLEEVYKEIVNYYVEVYEEQQQITFLYHVKKGKVNKSYGINVARLAHLPERIINLATNILKDLESNHKVIQQSFTIEENIVEEKNDTEEKIMMVDINNLTPIEALQMIDDLQKDIKKKVN